MIQKFSIFNLPAGRQGYQFSLKKEGFTLIELLVAISVISVISIMVGGILVSTLRGSSKATVLSDVKSNGDIVLQQMTKVIRTAANADVLPCGNPSSPVQSITVTQLDKTQTTFACAGNTITSNGTSMLDTSSVAVVPSSCSFTCSQPTVISQPKILIQFTLQQKGTANFVEQSANSTFQTSVILLNVNLE